jgi:hypothetical protein
MNPYTFFTTFIGRIAAEAIESHASGVVMGLSSKGIFLHLGDSILFITDAPYKSPFNIYVPGFNRLMNLLEQNVPFEVIPGAIVFHSHAIKLITENAEVWTPPAPVEINSSQSQRIASANALVARISEIDPQKGWIFLYNKLTTLPGNMVERITLNTQSFVNGYKKGDLELCLSSADYLLGLGGGLTPSGDDWLTGFLLYQTRFLQTSNLQSDFSNQMKNALTAHAFQKTTTISANRIAAAGRGWAEESFLQVIDSLFSGDEMPAGLAEILTHFGHSSGVDTTVGIAASLACEYKK